MKKILMFFLPATIILAGSCKDEFTGSMELNIRNETDQPVSDLKLFTMQNESTKLDSMVIGTIESEEELTISYKPENAKGGSDWMLTTSTLSARFGYHPISLEKGSNVHYVRIMNDTIMISSNKEGFW